MKFLLFLLRFICSVFLATLLSIPFYIFFKPIYCASSVIIPYAIYPFDICISAPIAWWYMKCFHFISSFYVFFLIVNSTFGKLLKKKMTTAKKQRSPINLKKSAFNLYLGKRAIDNTVVYLPEKSLYQNILITGTIGTGKTSSSMYPFAKQIIEYEADDEEKKFGMLILDVKGNFYKQIKVYAEQADRLDDLYIIELGGNIKYNPLDKPYLKSSVLANRLKTILTLFSPNNSESYWLDKAEEVLTECIKLCRLYNNGYVTFIEIHKLVNSPNYYDEKIKVLRELFKSR